MGGWVNTRRKTHAQPERLIKTIKTNKKRRDGTNKKQYTEKEKRGRVMSQQPNMPQKSLICLSNFKKKQTAIHCYLIERENLE